MWLLPPRAQTPAGYGPISCGWKLEKMMTPERPKVWVITRSSACSFRNQPLFLPPAGLSTKSAEELTSAAVTSMRLVVRLRLRQPLAGGEVVVDDQVEPADLAVEVPEVLAVAGAEGEGEAAQLGDVEERRREVDRPAQRVEDREGVPRRVGDPLHRRGGGEGRHRLGGGERDVLQRPRRADVDLVQEAGGGADVDRVQVAVEVGVEHGGVGGAAPTSLRL